MKVVKTSDMPWSETMQRGNYGTTRKDLGGLDLLRCGLYRLAPGKKSFPLHRHHGSDEALFVISGRARVRTELGEQAVGPGDYVAFPPGGVAHQLINDGDEPVVYLGMSANRGTCEVVEYPESKKVAGSVRGAGEIKRFIMPTAGLVDYFHDDPDA